MASFGVKFWGTRGLVSSPRLDTAVFGGNTPCVQILGGDELVVVDSGFGIANLGEQLLARILSGGEKLKVHIFYTHFHWDHVQGLPFFKPIYFESTELHLYSPETEQSTLDSLNILFDGSYSPFESLLKMQAKVKIHQLSGPMRVGDLTVRYQAVDHGDAQDAAADDRTHATYAYRFTNGSGKSVSLVTDHEARSGGRNDAVVAFAKDSDILIHDCQYLPAEYPQKVGWGHSSTTQALENALRIQPSKLLLTHHDPSRSDQELMREHRSLMQKSRYRGLAFEFAREEVEYAATLQVPSPLKAG